MFLRLGGMGRVPITAKSLLPSPATCLLSILLTFSQSSCLYRPVSRPSRLALMLRMVLWKVSSPFVGISLGLVRYGAAGRLFGCRWWRLWASPLPPFVSLHPRRLLTSCVGCTHHLISRVGAALDVDDAEPRPVHDRVPHVDRHHIGSSPDGARPVHDLLVYVMNFFTL